MPWPALAAGIAAMQAFMAIVVGEALPATFFAAALAATAACAFVSDGSRLRRAAYLAGGRATMAGVSALVTRRMLVGDGESPEEADGGIPPNLDPPVGWIEDDREGALTA